MSLLQVYNGYSPQHYSGRVIVTYVITLLGRHRHLKAQFFYNTVSQTTFSTKKNDNLQELLKSKFGDDAVGILVEGEAWHHEEELLRAELLRESGGRYHVLYDDSSPSYSEATALPPVLDIPVPALPTFQDLQEGRVRTTLAEEERRERRAFGYTYYLSTPSFTRSIVLRTCDGRSKPFVMHNLDTDHLDQLNHFLSHHAGDRWVGVLVGTREFTDDNLMFSAEVKEGSVYSVTYRPPGRLNLLDRSKEKKRQVVYSTLTNQNSL